MRQLCKLILNSCYGKFATYPLVGMIFTAYARRKTIQMVQLYGDRFVYADTDSVHVLEQD